MFAGATKVLVAKGKKVLTFQPGKADFDRDEFASVVLGPTGNLRAPTVVRGKTVLVGFNGDVFDEVLG